MARLANTHDQAKITIDLFRYRQLTYYLRHRL